MMKLKVKHLSLNSELLIIFLNKSLDDKIKVSTLM